MEILQNCVAFSEYMNFTDKFDEAKYIKSASTDAEAGPLQAGGPGRHVPPHFLTDQLTLSQPGGHIIPTQYYVPSRIFRPCDSPVSIEFQISFYEFFASLLCFFVFFRKNNPIG